MLEVLSAVIIYNWVFTPVFPEVAFKCHDNVQKKPNKQTREFRDIKHITQAECNLFIQNTVTRREPLKRQVSQNNWQNFGN
jgi:hypothetical protein